MKTIKALYILLVLLFVSPAFSEVDSSYLGYDQIVNNLSRSTSRIPQDGYDPLESIQMHTGLGFATSYVSIDAPRAKINSAFLKGVQLSFGIDLFSPIWAAEGSMRSFGVETLEDKSEVSLKEFDLRLLFKRKFTPSFGMKVGAGMAARYLNFNYYKGTQFIRIKETTPSSLFSGSIEAFITPSLSVGGEVVYRSALIGDTIDKRALDTNIRVDAHF